MEEEMRQIIFYKNYFPDFYLEQSLKVQDKFDYVFRVVKTSLNISKKFLQYITGTDELYEIKVEYNSNIYRVFCCFDKGRLVVLFNVFQKKTQKTPQNEIDMALKLKEEYFNSKKA
jgi:phage-related protein